MVFSKIEEQDDIKPLSIINVALVELKYNIKLPKDYISLLQYQNGGYTKKLILKEYKDYFELDRISGIQGNEGDILQESDYYIKEWGLPKDILLLSGGGHWWIFLDYRNLNKQNEPKVSYIDLELDKDIIVANSFQEFLDLLIESIN